MSDSPKRIGVYGGTFDPIHSTHLEIARAAARHAKLDTVLFVVAAVPPHKRNGVSASPEDRLALVEAALHDEPAMEASRIEMDRNGPSYTADTLIALEKQYPQAAFYLILGSDSLTDLPRWRRPEEILSRARLLVAQRPGAATDAPASLEGKYDVLPITPKDTSSQIIRQMLAAGEDISTLVPQRANDLILEKELYGAHR